MKASKHIRDHVSTYGKEIKKATAKKFGINNSLIIRAVNGDEKALKEIGDMGRTGERLAMAMPLIRENLKAYIEGTTEYNTALADIYKSGSKGAIAIDKAASDVTLENSRYNNLIEEYKTSLFAKLESENQRHDDALGIAYLSWTKKAEIDELSAHSELEAYKSCIKLTTVSSQNEREFKTLQTNRVWDKQKVKHGFISVEAMQDKLIRQQEIQDKTHTSTLKQFDLADSDMDKKIAENLRDKHKALSDTQKILGKKSGNDWETSNNPESHIQERVNQLIEALKRWEDGWLYTIIKNNKPLWLIGSQGSGKTNTAGCIAIIRKYCFDAPIYQLIDRHATGENWKVWQLLDAQIKAESESEIGQALEDACSRWLARIKEVPKQKQQLVIDEFTNLKKIASCKESAMKFFSMHLTDTRKAKEYFIGINHYFTNESTVEGTFEARKAGTIQIKKFSANGETPLPRVQIVHGLVDSNGNELEEVEVTLPSWFEAVQIYNHFNGKPINFEG